MKSIRFFLVITTLSTLTLVIFLSALNGYQKSIAKAEALFDMELINKAHLLAMTFHGFKKKPITLKKELNTDHFIFQIWHKKKLLQTSTARLKKPISPFISGFSEKNFLNYRWRVYSYYSDQLKVWILTAERVDIRYILAEQIILKVIIPVIVIIPLLGLLIWGIISYGLRPLNELAKALTVKQMSDLSPLILTQQPLEIIPLTQAINHLLKRLENAFQREKNFTSDAAHELRTPLSAIKIHLYNLSQQMPENLHFKQLQMAVERMEHLVEQILDLNRTSSEQARNQFITLDLYQISQDMIARDYIQFDKKQLQISLLGDSAPFKGDLFAIELLIQNLLSNAAKYTPCKGTILVTIENHQNQVSFKIEDSGIGVKASEYTRLFDRFYRVKGDCHPTEISGCGLGLAIVKQIALLHQADIILDQSPSLKGFLIQINFKKGINL